MLQLPAQLSRRLALLGLAAFFIVAGGFHFVKPDLYVAIVPPYLPAQLELVYLSGVFEILGGVAVLVPGIRTRAGWGLILLLVAIYPANVHMALHPELFPDISAVALYARMPFQILFIAWAYWATRPDLRAVAETSAAA